MKKGILLSLFLAHLGFTSEMIETFVKAIPLGKICLLDAENGRVRVCNEFGLYIEDFTFAPDDRKHLQEVKNNFEACYNYLKKHLTPINKKVFKVDKYLLQTEKFQEKIMQVVEEAKENKCKDVLIQIWN